MCDQGRRTTTRVIHCKHVRKNCSGRVDEQAKESTEERRWYKIRCVF